MSKKGMQGLHLFSPQWKPRYSTISRVEPLTEKRMKTLKVLVFLAFAGTVAYLIFFTSPGNLFLTPEGRKELVGKIDLLVRAAGPFGPLFFILIYTLGVLGLPATPFNAAGAIIFGKYIGTAYNIVGAALGASLSFVLGRYLLRDFAKGLLTGKLGELDRKAEKHGFSLVFYLRIVLFPFIVLNYGAGVTRIRFGDFFWGTFLGTMPAIVIVSYFFGSLKEIIATYRGPADLLQFDVLVPVALLGFSFFIPAIVRRIRGEPLSETAPAAEPE
jgi:uncharacterized membrane protein YdjX (TVP38/TMEM64 family)